MNINQPTNQEPDMKRTRTITTYSRRSTTTLGTNRNRARVYLQGKWLARAGFTAGQPIAAEFNDGHLTLRLDAAGQRLVSSKSKGSIPVIDINNDELREALGYAADLEVVTRLGTITITPSKTERHKARRTRNGLEGSVFAGGGLLTDAARQAGYQCAWAVEIDSRYAEHFEQRHPAAIMHNMSIHELDGTALTPVELMTIGLPCEPFSVGRNGRRGEQPEDHPHGDLVYWALRLIEEVAPYTVVLEEVPGFLKSGAGYILQGALRRMGYTVEARVINSADYGELTARKRAVVIATTDDQVAWPEPCANTRTLGDLLERVPADDPCWWDESTKGWWFAHRAKHAAKGNGWGSRVMSPTDTKIGCITKRYFSGQAGPVIAHPTRPDTYRWLTVDEVARLHGLPGGYMDGLPKTVAGEVLGQGVVVPTFAKVINAAAGDCGAR